MLIHFNIPYTKDYHLKITCYRYHFVIVIPLGFNLYQDTFIGRIFPYRRYAHFYHLSFRILAF